jgi:hypothetical protein
MFFDPSLLLISSFLTKKIKIEKYKEQMDADMEH